MITTVTEERRVCDVCEKNEARASASGFTLAIMGFVLSLCAQPIDDPGTALTIIALAMACSGAAAWMALRRRS